jgi:hypothetical protein
MKTKKTTAGLIKLPCPMYLDGVKIHYATTAEAKRLLGYVPTAK